MRKLIFLLITLTTHINVSYASFPVFSTINEAETRSDSNLIVFGLFLILSIVGLIYNKRKYGTYYNPNNIYEEWIWKNGWIILLIVIGILALGMSAISMR